MIKNWLPHIQRSVREVLDAKSSAITSDQADCVDSALIRIAAVVPIHSDESILMNGGQCMPTAFYEGEINLLLDCCRP